MSAVYEDLVTGSSSEGVNIFDKIATFQGISGSPEALLVLAEIKVFFSNLLHNDGQEGVGLLELDKLCSIVKMTAAEAMDHVTSTKKMCGQLGVDYFLHQGRVILAPKGIFYFLSTCHGPRGHVIRNIHWFYMSHVIKESTSSCQTAALAKLALAEILEDSE